MKMIWNVFVGFVLLNLLAAAGFVGWMYMDGRVNQERIDQVKDIFSLRIDEEQAQEELNLQLEEENQKKNEQMARLESTGKGPLSVNTRLDQQKQADERALAKLQLFNDQNKALREEMARFKEDHAQRVAQLQKERDAFEQWVEDYAAKTKDENFQQVVGLYEKQAPKQTKEAFQTLMQSGEIDQVVDYLAAMSSRKAGAVLGQFKTPAEIAEATRLLEMLRTRGEYVMDPEDLPLGN